MGCESFFWRYFNCGRFPSQQSEIDYYGCPKWVVQGRPAYPEGFATPPPYPVAPGDEALGTE